MSDFERCSELRDWRRAHAGDVPRQRSDNEYEQSLARWYSKALQRQHRALSSRPSERQLTPNETAHLNSIVRIAIESPAAAPVSDFERCSELRDWRRAHAGDLPSRSSDNEYEQSIARWYSKASQRQHRALSSRPSQRQLTPDETAHLDSIVRMAIEAPAAAPVEPLRKRQRAKSSSAPGSASSSNASPAPSSCAPPGLRHSGGRQSNRRGKVLPHRDGFRVQATIDKKTVYGPLRSTEADLILRYPNGS